MVTLSVPLQPTVAVFLVIFALNPIATCYSIAYMMFLAIATSIGLSIPQVLVGQPLREEYRLAQMPYVAAVVSTVTCACMISSVSDAALEPEHHNTRERSWLFALLFRVVLTLCGMAVTEYADRARSPFHIRGIIPNLRFGMFTTVVIASHVAFLLTLFSDVRVEEVELQKVSMIASIEAHGSGESADAEHYGQAIAFLGKVIWTHRVLCNVLIISTFASLIRTLQPWIKLIVIAWTNGIAEATSDGSGVWHYSAKLTVELWRAMADLAFSCCVIPAQMWLLDDDDSHTSSPYRTAGQASSETIPWILQVMIVFRFYNLLVAWSANTAYARLLDLFELRPATNPLCVVDATNGRGGAEDPQPSCIICLGPLGHRQTCVLPCHHEFHAQCLQSWLLRKRQCPVCRDDPWQRLLANLRREQQDETTPPIALQQDVQDSSRELGILLEGGALHPQQSAAVHSNARRGEHSRDRSPSYANFRRATRNHSHPPPRVSWRRTSMPNESFTSTPLSTIPVSHRAPPRRLPSQRLRGNEHTPSNDTEIQPPAAKRHRAEKPVTSTRKAPPA